MMAEPNAFAKQHDLFVHANVVSGHCMHRDSRVSLYFMEGISHSLHLYENITDENPYFFTQLPWHHDREMLKVNFELFELASGLSRDRVILLANSHEELEAALELGCNKSRLVSQNAWLDYNIFKPNFASPKDFDLVINCRPEKWKRPYLAKQVADLAIIKGANHRPSDYFCLEDLSPKFINPDRMSPNGVIDVLNRAYCGGIFSEEEGGCYSSSEYLLMGLPVVSTPSRGGRDLWYTDDNSVIVDPDEGLVREAVEGIKEGLLSGRYSPEFIRESHIARSNYFRGVFVEMIESLVEDFGLDGKKIFLDNYKHKMVRYSVLNE